MTLDDVLKKVPELSDYVKTMPDKIRERCVVKVHPPGYIIHQKDAELDYFGIVAAGEHRVINEFENGNVFMIERNEPIDFIGEVTILADMPRTSVTIETTTESIIIYMSRKDFEEWIAEDIYFLRLVSRKVAFKLYRSSYNRGAKLFYPPHFLLLDFLMRYAQTHPKKADGTIVLPMTRQEICEETGITVKTLNRTIARLKEDDVLGIYKGKIMMDAEQLERMGNYISPFSILENPAVN